MPNTGLKRKGRFFNNRGSTLIADRIRLLFGIIQF